MGLLFLLILGCLSGAPQAQAANRAIIVHAAQDIFYNEYDYAHMGLESRGFEVTGLTQEPLFPLTNTGVMQAIQEKIEDTKSGDKLLLMLLCHGSSAHINLERTHQNRNHRCCLNFSCSEYVTTHDILIRGRTIPSDAQFALMDRSCYSGNTLNIARELNSNHCVMVNATDSAVSYATVGSLGDYLSTPGAKNIAQYALFAATDTAMRMPNRPYLTATTSDCSPGIVLRGLLKPLGLPLLANYPADSGVHAHLEQHLWPILLAQRARQTPQNLTLIASSDPLIDTLGAGAYFSRGPGVARINAALQALARVARQHGATTEFVRSQVTQLALSAFETRVTLEEKAQELIQVLNVLPATVLNSRRDPARVVLLTEQIHTLANTLETTATTLNHNLRGLEHGICQNQRGACAAFGL